MIIRGAFSDFYLTTMLPALRGVVSGKFKQYPTQFDQIFLVENSTRSIEQMSELSGVGQFSTIGEGQPVRFDTPIQGFDKTFTHTRFGLGIQTTQDAVEDDKIGLIYKSHADLAISAKDTMELDAAATFNNGFSGSYLGPDGKALFALDHPLYKSGGTQANTATAADLDIVSLQAAMTDFETQKDPAGRLIHVPCQKLVVPPQSRFIAYEITESAMRPDTTNNAVNALKFAADGMPSPFVWRYLTDPDSWYLLASPENTGLIWFWRRKTYSKQWFDDYTETGNYAVRYKKSHGWFSFYGTYGNPGA
jgi:phage major head subunit gpT-like protein